MSQGPLILAVKPAVAEIAHPISTDCLPQTGCPPKIERLLTRPQFQAALAGKTISKTAHFAMHRAPLSLAGPNPKSDALTKPLFARCGVWLGAMVPKRWAKRAVTRNAIRRQIYAISLDFAPRLDVAAHVVRLRSAFDPKVFISARSEVLRLAIRSELRELFEAACQAGSVNSRSSR